MSHFPNFYHPPYETPCTAADRDLCPIEDCPCIVAAARAELKATGATYWADRETQAGILPKRWQLPEAERLRVYAPEQP